MGQKHSNLKKNSNVNLYNLQSEKFSKIEELKDWLNNNNIDIKSPDDRGCYILYYFCQNRNMRLETLEWLVENGADITCTDYNDRNILDIALYTNSVTPEIVQFLHAYPESTCKLIFHDTLPFLGWDHAISQNEI